MAESPKEDVLAVPGPSGLNIKYKNMIDKLKRDKQIALQLRSEREAEKKANKAGKQRELRIKKVTEIQAKKKTEIKAKEKSNETGSSANLKATKILNMTKKESITNGTLVENLAIKVATVAVKKTKKKNTSKNVVKKHSTKRGKSDEERRKFERERKRKQREKIKANPEALEKCRQYERQRNQKRREEGKLKSISEKSKREQRRQRKMWRENKLNQKKRLSAQHALQATMDRTPPESLNSCNGRQATIRKKVRRDRTRTVRELNKAKHELKKTKALMEKWKKRFHRVVKQTPKESPSPRKKVKILLKKGQNEIRKRLLFGESLVAQLKAKAISLKSGREKQTFVKCLAGQVLKKYRCLNQARPFLTTRMNKRYTMNTTVQYTRKRRNDSIGDKEKNAIISFLEEDINSCLAPGKRDTITRHKLKKQKRYLLDNLVNLHRKYIETTQTDLSYASFCKNKPFWVVKPRVLGRDTCMCIKHANFQFLVDKLHYLKLTKYSKAEDLAATMCCDKKNKDCMYKECSRCKGKEFSPSLTEEKEQQTFHYKWIKKTEKRIDRKKKPIVVKFVTKEKVECSTENLIKETQNQLPVFLQHVFNVGHQFAKLKQLKGDLDDNEALILIDFSENYECKYASEIQSAHFGASKSQITLHTGVVYLKNTENEAQESSALDCTNEKESLKYTPVQFATLSESLRHDPPAVWAHLTPILSMLKESHPNINKIHFQSDGPTTQYKNKTNFFLFSHFSASLGLKESSWNFSEPGHGKSSADGVGGQLKALADQAVAHGADVTNADMLYATLKASNTKVKLFQVHVTDIERVDTILPKLLKPVPQTMKLRQLVWKDSSNMQLGLRTLTCFTCGSLTCKHFASAPSTWNLIDNHGLPNKRKKFTASAKASNKKGLSTRALKTNNTMQHKCCHQNDKPFMIANQNEPHAQESDIHDGEWVAVCYGSLWYLGFVACVAGKDITVTYMHREDDVFFWPKKTDSHTLPMEEIMCKVVSPPKKVFDKFYSINDLEEYDAKLRELLDEYVIFLNDD